MIDWTPEEEEAWQALSESSSCLRPTDVPRDNNGTPAEHGGTSADARQGEGGAA